MDDALRFPYTSPFVYYFIAKDGGGDRIYREIVGEAGRRECANGESKYPSSMTQHLTSMWTQ